MKLYSYWRSTTSYRVRAALNLKGIDYDICPVDLVAGAQHEADYLQRNPGAGVPCLVLDDGTTLTQSLAIIDYLDALYPAPRLVPIAPQLRARVQAVAQTVALDIHPLNNLRVIGQLKARFNADADQCQDWMCHWMAQGFAAVEALLDAHSRFAFSATPDLADLCIVAQVYNARRWGLDLRAFPKVLRVEAAALQVPEILAAHPDQQSQS